MAIATVAAAPVAAAAMSPAPPSPGVADGGQRQGALVESAAPWDYDQPLRYDDGDDRRRAVDQRPTPELG